MRGGRDSVGCRRRAVWPEFAFIVVMGALVAALAWNSAVREIGPQNGALFINLVPVTAIASSIGGGYRPGAVELAGAGLTIAALVGGNLLAARRAGAAPASAHADRRQLPGLDPPDQVLGLLADPGAVLELDRRQLRLTGVLLDVRPPAAHERLLDMLVGDAGVLDGLEHLPARVAAVDPGVGAGVNLDRHGADATPSPSEALATFVGPRCRRSSSTPIFTPDRRPAQGDRPDRRSAWRPSERFVTLLGATGTGKTMTMAATIERLQRPALVMAHNKTLAAQLCNEFRTFFPDNAVEYFVSYYDYYQPEAYVPSKDLYIEKDSAINQEIDRLRHAATAALFGRRDVIIVASVSAIFGMGSPETYDRNMVLLKRGDDVDRDELLRKLVSIQYTRNDTALGAATSACGASRWRSSRPTRSRPTACSCSATRSSACSTSTR